MNRKYVAALVCLSLFFAMLACKAVEGGSSNTPVQEATAVQQAATAAVAPTATEDLAATEAAEKSIAQATEKAASATAEAQSAAATQAAAKAATQTAAAKKTQQAEARQALTESVKMLATQQAADMYGLVDQLNKEGIIKRSGGEYYTVDDFEESWAQIGWYQWWKTGLKPSNFVMRANTTWESASKTADWWTSGCGFVFRESDSDNHYMIFLALDGWVYMQGFVNGNYRDMGREYYGKVGTTEGEAEVILVADGTSIVYYVNGKKVYNRKNETFKHGSLGLTLVSGTNKDFGTRCTISDIEVWDLGD